jgi:outer membrane lipoprotein LolB
MPGGSRAVAVSMRPLQLVALLAAVLWLTACQTVPKASTPTVAPATVVAGWPARRLQLQARLQFTAQGRIGVVAGADGFNGHLRWVQDGTRCTVSLDGPLGVAGVRVVADGGALTVTNPSGEALDSQAAHDTLVRRLGFEPPLDSLRYWIQGVPDPATLSTETPNAQGYLGTLAQSGWTVTFSDYMPTPDGALPRKMTLARDTVRVKLVIEAWHSP